MLNLAGFGPKEHTLLMQGGIEGLRDILRSASTTSGCGSTERRRS